MEYYVITFASTHGAMAAEKHLKEQFKIAVLPTPREISKGCGIAIRFRPEDREGILGALEGFPLDKNLYGVYHFVDGGYTKALQEDRKKEL